MFRRDGVAAGESNFRMSGGRILGPAASAENVKLCLACSFGLADRRPGEVVGEAVAK